MAEPARIFYEGKEYDCAVCEKCGGKVYPPEVLKAHLKRHVDGERAHLHRMKVVQRELRRSRL